MSDEKISRSLDHIMRDSLLWSECAEMLSQKAVLATELPVTGAQFSYLADRAGVTRAYDEIRLEMVRLLGDGALAQQDIAERLKKVAKAYEGDESDAAERMRKIERQLEGGD